jgi:uncharacterized membrane protein YdbT with pleckstrin-like domain
MTLSEPNRLIFMRWGILVLALLAPFFFPLPATIMLAVIAGYFFPPLVLVIGVLLDTLYFIGKGIPLYSLAGIAGVGIMLYVRQFVKARMMS